VVVIVFLETIFQIQPPKIFYETSSFFNPTQVDVNLWFVAFSKKKFFCLAKNFLSLNLIYGQYSVGRVWRMLYVHAAKVSRSGKF
jgi:hypothetical protein